MTGNTANNDSPFTNEETGDPGKVMPQIAEGRRPVSLTSKLMMFPLCCSKEGERRKRKAKGGVRDLF